MIISERVKELYRKFFFLPNEFETGQIMQNFFDLKKNIFGQTCKMDQILLKMVLLQNDLQTAILALSCVEAFSKEIGKNLLLSLKIEYLIKKQRVIQNVIFSHRV